ncbi:MAG TPA: aminopeptidase [Syntrophales bacterium]|nr:aminopeptidase [Syntrophales bacterium]
MTAKPRAMELTEKHLERYADVLLWGLSTARDQKFRKNETVLVRFDRPALALAEILHEKLLRRGLNVLVRMGLTPKMEKSFFDSAGSRQLVFVPPGDRELFENLNGSVYLHSPDSLTHLSHVDPKRIGKALVARKPLREILEKREEQGVFGWTLCTFPTEKLAEHAGMSIGAYREQIVKACYLDRDEPVAEWKAVYRKVSRIKKWLNGLDVAFFRVRSASTDLTITPGKMRRWIGISGHNIPSFEIFLSPDWRGTEGTYFADQPSYRSGNYVEGVRLVFREGRVVEVSAAKGEAFVKKQVDMDRGACRIGEFSLTDRRFSRIDRFMADTLFDENFGGSHGNCHVALGSSYSDTYAGDPSRLTKSMKRSLGFNDSALHWDLVNTEPKTVTARLETGREILVYENGVFCVPGRPLS